MSSKISILFYSKIAKKTKEELIPIYLRITIDGKRIEQSTNRTVQLSKWSNKAGKMRGTSADARVLNSFLDAIRNKVYATERELVQDGKVITYQSSKEKWFGVDIKTHMVLETFQQHNDQVAQLVGKDYSAATLQRYKTSLDHTRNYIQWKYKLPDLDVNKLNYVSSPKQAR